MICKLLIEKSIFQILLKKYVNLNYFKKRKNNKIGSQLTYQRGHWPLREQIKNDWGKRPLPFTTSIF